MYKNPRCIYKAHDLCTRPMMYVLEPMMCARVALITPLLPPLPPCRDRPPLGTPPYTLGTPRTLPRPPEDPTTPPEDPTTPHVMAGRAVPAQDAVQGKGNVLTVCRNVRSRVRL